MSTVPLLVRSVPVFAVTALLGVAVTGLLACSGGVISLAGDQLVDGGFAEVDAALVAARTLACTGDDQHRDVCCRYDDGGLVCGEWTGTTFAPCPGAYPVAYLDPVSCCDSRGLCAPGLPTDGDAGSLTPSDGR